MLRRIPFLADRRLLVGSATADDAGVFQIDRDRALVQTVDFFTPIVDDPFLYGQISAANALSDVYAMGGRPLTAINILGIPEEKVPPRMIREILRGGALKAKEAGCVLLGGHTIRNPEPIYGLSVTGLVSPRRMLTNAAARPGDLLVLTKPLGTGIASTGIKRGWSSAALARKAVAVMRQVNKAGAELGESGLVKAATDVTGFGLFGHLAAMCKASSVSAEVDVSKLPVLSAEIFELIERGCVPGGSKQNLASADRVTEWGDAKEAQRLLATDAQTSGGLLLCVRPSRWAAVAALLRKARVPCAAMIGRIVTRQKRLIQVK